MPWFSAITGGLGEQNPYDAVADWSNNTQRRNRAAVGLDANGNPLPTDASGNPAPDPNSPQNDGTSAHTGQALAGGQMQPQQQPQSTKTDPSLGALLMNLTQYQQREQGFNQAMGAGFAAVSQPRDRDWVRGIFNVNEPDPMKIGQQEQDLASQQQGQDRMNSLGALISGPQGAQIAQSLNISQADLIARYRADPQGVGTMIQNFRQPTDQLKNLQQIQDYLRGKGATAGDLGLLTPALVAQVGGPTAEKAIGDAMAYRATHGKDAPWVGPGGVNVDAYNQWSGTQKAISDNQSSSAAALGANLTATDTLRQKLSDLQNNPGLAKILNAAPDSPLKQAATDAVNDPDANWQKKAVYSVLVNDPEALKAISELKEINGQEYTSALHSLLGHGLRPSQTEVGAVREGFGQTKNLNLFGNPTDYNAQAIQPLLTRLDEAQAEGYGSSGQLKNAPERLRPFIDKTYLSGGAMHLDDGSQPLDWEGSIHKPLPDDVSAAAQAKIRLNPKNAFAIRDGLRRQGYDVDF